MKDFPEKNDEQAPIVSIIKEFAWYLKESARKLDNDVAEVRRENKNISDRVLILEMQVKTCMEKIMEKYDAIEEKMDSRFTMIDENKKAGWSVAEKIGVVVAWLIPTVISILGLILK